MCLLFFGGINTCFYHRILVSMPILFLHIQHQPVNANDCIVDEGAGVICFKQCIVVLQYLFILFYKVDWNGRLFALINLSEGIFSEPMYSSSILPLIL